MKRMAAGKFKAQCLALLDAVEATGEPLVITKRGRPVAKVVPFEAENRDIFGYMAGKVRIVGDIESPIPVEWGESEE
jgi:prevent-host-death family protein